MSSMTSVFSSDCNTASRRFFQRGGVIAVWFALGTSLFVTSCEDKAIGRMCEALAPDGGTQLAVFNGQALECPTRLCLRPAKEYAVSADVDTGSLCTAECSRDKDCEDGETRGDVKDKDDKRCRQGWVCGISYVTGPLKCKRLCMCKDFLPKEGAKDPPSCVGK